MVVLEPVSKFCSAVALHDWTLEELSQVLMRKHIALLACLPFCSQLHPMLGISGSLNTSRIEWWLNFMLWTQSILLSTCAGQKWSVTSLWGQYSAALGFLWCRASCCHFCHWKPAKVWDLEENWSRKTYFLLCYSGVTTGATVFKDQKVAEGVKSWRSKETS